MTIITLKIKKNISKSKEEHLRQLARKPKVVDSPDPNEKGSDAWFHFDALYDRE